MSDTDSFIDEVNEEVRRDRLYGYLRRYGWIGILLVVLIVGGAAWSEWQKAQTASRAEALGDALLAAYEQNDQAERASALSAITAEDPKAQAALNMIVAAELAAAENTADAAARLNRISDNGDVPEVYRNLAGFKALLIQSETLDADARRTGFGSFAIPGNPMRMLALEQLALIEVETNNVDAALEQLQAILVDAESTSGLQQRAMQVMVALGGEPDLSVLSQEQN